MDKAEWFDISIITPATLAVNNHPEVLSKGENSPFIKLREYFRWTRAFRLASLDFLAEVG